MATNNFLSTKSFHPGTKANRAAVWEAEQKHKETQKILEERATVIKREQDEFAGILNQFFWGNFDDKFLIQGESERKKQSLAFMYSQPRFEKEVEKEKVLQVQQYLAQAKTNEARAKKGAGDSWCTRCNVRGHTQNDEDCPLRNADPTNPFQQRLDDPMKLLNLRKKQLLEEGSIDPTGVLSVTFQRQVDPNDPNNQLLYAEEDDVVDELDVERKFLASLSEKEKEMLIKHFKRQSKKEKKEKKKEKKEKKKRKREKEEDQKGDRKEEDKESKKDDRESKKGSKKDSRK